jgi:quercetin dioxygenase-like cupin family protein
MNNKFRNEVPTMKLDENQNNELINKQRSSIMRKLTGKIAKTAVKKLEKERQQEAKMKAQDRGTGATPAAGAKAGATQGSFTTSDAISWKPVDAKKHPGLMMSVVWGNPNEGASLILQKYPAGMKSGWHWHTAAYDGVVIQGNFTHTFKGAAPQTGGPGSVWSQPAGQVHNDKCEESGDSIIAVYFHGKLDFIPVPVKAQ